MRTSGKIGFGLAAFFPGVTALLFIVFTIFYPPSMLTANVAKEPGPPTEFLFKLLAAVAPWWLTAAAIGAISAAIVLGVIIHVFRGSRVAADKRWPWTVVMLLGAPLALPIYWHVHVWSTPGVGAAPMRLSRRAKIALLAASLATLAFAVSIVVATAAITFGTVFAAGAKNARQAPVAGNIDPARQRWGAQQAHRETMAAARPWFQVSRLLNLANGLLCAGLVAIFLMHAFRSARLQQGQLILWICLLAFASRLAMPIYWYVYVWKDSGDRAPDANQ